MVEDAAPKRGKWFNNWELREIRTGRMSDEALAERFGTNVVTIRLIRKTRGA